MPDTVYTIVQLKEKTGVPIQTLISRMRAIAQATGKKWRKFRRIYYINEEELVMLTKVHRGEHFHPKPMRRPKLRHFGS